MNIEKIKEIVMAASNVKEINEITVTKNGADLQGLQIITGKNINPVIYYNSCDDPEVIADRILEAVNNLPELNAEDMTNPDYILTHAFFSIQRPGYGYNQGFITKPLMNQELSLRISVNLGGNEGSTRLSPEMLEQADLSPDKVWEAAFRNMEGKFQIINITDMFGMFMPMEMFVVQDAAVLAFPEVFRDFCKSESINSCLILPSSTEEVIVLPEGVVKENSAEMLNMVHDINKTVVDPLIWLEPAVYKYVYTTNEIQMLCSGKNAVSA